MVVLHIAHLKNNPYSGVCVVVSQHIKEQQKLHEVALLNLCDEEIEGIEHQFTYCDQTGISGLPEPFCKPDIVIFQEVYRKPYPAIARLLYQQRIPYVVFPHGSLTEGAQEIKKWKKRFANALLFRRFVERADAIHCLSKSEEQTSHFKNRTFVCPNGMLLPKKQKESFSSDKTKFVYIGRTNIVQKGLDILVDAVALVAACLREHDSCVHLYGPDRFGSHEVLKNMIEERNISDILVLHDGVTGEEKERILLDADVFIQTSRFEGIPTGVLEALGYGLPCLVTEGTYVDNFVKQYQAGWTAAVNREAVAEAIQEAVLHPETRTKQSLAAVKIIQENFLWDKICSETLSYYEQICTLRESEG